MNGEENRNIPSTYQQVLDNKDRIDKLEAGIDAANVKSVDGSKLSLDVIPDGAFERVYDIEDLDILGDKDDPRYPDGIGNGDTVHVINAEHQEESQMYYVSDEDKLGTDDYMQGLKIYAAGNASTVNGHTVEQDVLSTSKLTDTIIGAYCSTAGDAYSKVAKSEGYVAREGTWIQLVLVNSNTANRALTLTINDSSQTTAPIFINDERTSSTNYNLPAGYYMVYYGTRNELFGYWFRTDGNLPNVNMPDVMVGATSTTAGKVGTVPAPMQGEQNKILSGAGTWINHTSIVTSTTQPSNQQVGDYWIEPF